MLSVTTLITALSRSLSHTTLLMFLIPYPTPSAAVPRLLILEHPASACLWLAETPTATAETMHLSMPAHARKAVKVQVSYD